MSNVDLDVLLAGGLVSHVTAHHPRAIDELVDSTIGPALAADVSSSTARLLQALRTYLDHDTA